MENALTLYFDAIPDGIRLVSARIAVKTGHTSLDRIAQESGFGDAGRMRRAFLRSFGQLPQAGSGGFPQRWLVTSFNALISPRGAIFRAFVNLPACRGDQ